MRGVTIPLSIRLILLLYSHEYIHNFPLPLASRTIKRKHPCFEGSYSSLMKQLLPSMQYQQLVVTKGQYSDEQVCDSNKQQQYLYTSGPFDIRVTCVCMHSPFRSTAQRSTVCVVAVQCSSLFVRPFPPLSPICANKTNKQPSFSSPSPVCQNMGCTQQRLSQ